MRIQVYLVMLLFVQLLQGQKVIKKSIINQRISFIKVDTNNCFKLVIATADVDEMIVEAVIDGEYKKDLMLKIHEEGATVFVSAGFQPNFIKPNDKLSAHKVISIDLKLVLPEFKEVLVYGTSCNVTASGNYKYLKIVSDDGSCNLISVSEDVEVKTQSGNILVSTSVATVNAKSKYGLIKKERLPIGKNQFNLTTTTGNILVKKTE